MSPSSTTILCERRAKTELSIEVSLVSTNSKSAMDQNKTIKTHFN